MSNVVIMSEDDYNTLKRAEEIQRALFNGMELVKKAKNESEKTLVICANYMARDGIKDTFKLIIDNVDNFEFITITEMEKIRGVKYKKILVPRTTWTALYDAHKDDYVRDILEPLEAAGATVAVIGL
jgi:hypothetical protein